jgi:hypothetical protein
MLPKARDSNDCSRSRNSGCGIEDRFRSLYDRIRASSCPAILVLPFVEVFGKFPSAQSDWTLRTCLFQKAFLTLDYRFMGPVFPDLVPTVLAECHGVALLTESEGCRLNEIPDLLTLRCHSPHQQAWPSLDPIRCFLIAGFYHESQSRLLS